MRHLNRGRQLSRNTSHRKALLRNMVTSLIEHGSIETTVAKAKELRSVADKLVTIGKRAIGKSVADGVHARRVAASFVRTESAVAKLFGEIAPGFVERAGGYTRIIQTRVRHGDGAPMAVIEFMPAGAPVSRGSVNPTAPVVKKAIIPETKESFGG
jgi:large subunit ribosomal protein L17